MNFNEINESTGQSVLGEDFAYLLKQDCQPFLQTDLYLKLFRGIDGMGSSEFSAISGYKMNTLSDRQPKDSSKATTVVMNKLYNAVGSPVTRNNSVFCASIGKAVGYGTPYMVFPIGDFDVLWHNKIEDAYIEFQAGAISKYYYTMHPHREQDFKAAMEKEMKESIIADAYRTLDSVTGPALSAFVKDAMASNEYKNKMNQKMGQEYSGYAKYGYGYLDYDKVADKFLDGFKTDPNDDWNPNVEIMVKCNSYYLINATNFSKFVKGHL